jgi:enoyl-CoA hydratase/carnithine racemase
VSEQILETVVDGPVTTLSMIYRPYNLASPILYAALLQAFQKAVSDGSRAILLKSGLRHFCAGADISLWDERIANEGRPRMSPLDVLHGFEQLPIPIVVAVHGACLGGGLEIALAVEATLGVHPLLGGIQRQAQRMGTARAKEMTMLGRRHDAATLEKWGLINRVVPDTELDEVALSVAHELAAGPTVAHAATKRLITVAINEGVEAADLTMLEIQKPIWASKDIRTGLESFRAEGPGLARFEGL